MGCGHSYILTLEDTTVRFGKDAVLSIGLLLFFLCNDSVQFLSLVQLEVGTKLKSSLAALYVILKYRAIVKVW